MKRIGKDPAPLGLLLFAGIFAAASLPLAAAAEPPQVTADSFHVLLDQALTAFSANDFATAAERFERLERDFGQEPDYREPDFLRRMLPLKGHAELATGRPGAASRSLVQFVDLFPDDPQHPAALHALGLSLRQEGKAEEALERFRQAAQLYPGRPESGLTLLQQTEILFNLGRIDEALPLLETFSSSEAPTVLRDQARLRAIRHLAEHDQPATALPLLLDHHWKVQNMPEVATLSFAALALGNRLLETEDFPNALRAYRLVLPHPRLLELQQQRIAEIQDNLKRPRNGSGHFWNHFYQKLLESLSRQNAVLAESDDYTPGLLLRRGQAMLLANRPHEAWLLFEQLALDESLPSAIREEAHYRWVVAASQLKLWEEALTIARNFLARYPEAPLAPQTLHLIAKAHHGQRRYPEASAILTDLLARYPAHPLAQRWRFNRGFNQTLIENFAAARSDFARAANDFPDGLLTPNSELWHALTSFFERDYPVALSELEKLADRYPNHPLTGEILYRRASTLYAMREYERAETETAGFVKEFQRHPRHGEALVLLGDILMGAGKLEEARSAFQNIQPEAGHLFLYGLFQQGKILRAREDYEQMIAHFTRYLERTDLDQKPRLSEALYWIGWAHAAQNRAEEAVPVFLKALQTHGDEPDSAEIGSILAQLERMHPWPDATTSDFSSWLETERAGALESGRFSYFARLTLHLAEIKRRQSSPHQADSLRFEIVNQAPIETLGPEALGQVGHFLSHQNLDAADAYFDALLKTYPHAPARAFAYHGLGKKAFNDGRYQEALVWFRRFDNETPTHALAPEALQLGARSHLQLKNYAEATAQFEAILRLRSLRGRPHAEALMGLADTMLASGETERAVAYYQRVYTVHRAQSDLVARAYFASSRLFEELEDPAAAHRSLAEMLSLTELADSEFYEQALSSEKRLAAELASADSSTPE